jgi:ribosomal protein L37AE/L43A
MVIEQKQLSDYGITPEQAEYYQLIKSEQEAGRLSTGGNPHKDFNGSNDGTVKTLDKQNNIDAVHSSGVNEEPPLCKAEPDLLTGPVNGITGFSQGAVGISQVSAAPGETGAAPMAAGDFQDLSDSQKNLIKSPAGMFWCYCHLQDLPIEKQSVDKRFCTRCYEVLADEADDMKAVGNRRRPWWVPCNRQPIGQVPVMVLGQVAQTQTVSVTPQNCLFCGKELTKRRKSKLFCGATCRVRYSRQQKDTVMPTLAERSFVNSKVNHKNCNIPPTLAECWRN